MTVRTKGEGGRGNWGYIMGVDIPLFFRDIHYFAIIDLGFIKILPHFLTRGLYNAAF